MTGGMMEIVERIAKIPLPRIIVITLLALLVLVVVEQLPWAQSFLEHWSNMEAPK